MNFPFVEFFLAVQDIYHEILLRRRLNFLRHSVKSDLLVYFAEFREKFSTHRLLPVGRYYQAPSLNFHLIHLHFPKRPSNIVPILIDFLAKNFANRLLNLYFLIQFQLVRQNLSLHFSKIFPLRQLDHSAIFHGVL